MGLKLEDFVLGNRRPRADMIVGDGDEKIRTVKYGRGFPVDLAIAAEYAGLEVVLVDWTVVVSFVSVMRYLPCVISIPAERQRRDLP